jgi:regulator of cell morphogenesis and NO signaling
MSTVVENILNVTLLEPRMKHPTIFDRFDKLGEGESLTILNDHDPKPLYYQLLAERGNIFIWEYLENGPSNWKIEITKIESKDKTLGELAANDFKKALVFKKFGLDFCCGGKKTVKEACAEKSIDPIHVENELDKIDNAPVQTALPYNDWSLDFLIYHIENTHHLFVNTTIAELCYYASKVMAVHGKDHPELIKINELVLSVFNELTIHMEKEEQILFPYIKTLESSKLTGAPFKKPPFETVKNPIQAMEAEHETVGATFEEIQKLTNHYTLPENACASYNLLYRMLKEFEEDLHIHVHLENNILFPKAIKLEKQLFGE